MITLIKTLSRIGVIILVVGITYLEPTVFATQPNSDQIPNANITTMSTKNIEHLDIVTRQFLKAIEESGSLYDSRHVSSMEEIIVRIRLQDAFEEYFSTLMRLEAREGLAVTERSREVVQETIAEFMESDTLYKQTIDISSDLDAYSQVLTESMIHAAVAV
ncbi:hypothetical protein K2P47_04980 [Patescibacteria group bacterium]|nr:hypothetical protein [Patescibacteria group bacterium]